jgi:hypothetical protein
MKTNAPAIMSSYEREYFVSRIRSGIYFIDLGVVRIKVLTPTVEDEFLSNEAFRETYEQSLSDDIFTEDQMAEWMLERGLWSEEQDEKIAGIKKDIDTLKVGIFQSRNDSRLVDQSRRYLRGAEKALSQMLAEKNDLFSKTCEGLASQARAFKLFERCCFLGSEPFDCDSIDIGSLFYNYNQMLLDESQLRFLARNDPWRLCWIMKDHSPLFANAPGRQLSNDQKGLLIWSNMYDNVQESMDCPTEDVINDDDMLDGWFIVQRKKQESDRAKTEISNRTNSKIANSDEIWIPVTSKNEAEKIHSLNSVHGDIVRKQRIDTVKKRGSAVDLDFQDRKIDVVNQQNQNFKQTTRRR